MMCSLRLKAHIKCDYLPPGIAPFCTASQVSDSILTAIYLCILWISSANHCFWNLLRACLHALSHAAISIPGSFVQRIKSLQKCGPQGCSAHWPLFPDIVGLIAKDPTSLDSDGSLPMALSRTNTIRSITVPPF